MIVFIKFILIVAIIVICIVLGGVKAKTYVKRVSDLKNIKNALNILKNKIQFTYETIENIFSEISKLVYEEGPNIFKSCIDNLKNLEMIEAWNKAVSDNKNYYTSEDLEILKMLGRDLGKLDKSGQISSINVVEGFIDSQIGKAENEKNKNYKLYKTLGAIIGCTIGILLF